MPSATSKAIERAMERTTDLAHLDLLERTKRALDTAKRVSVPVTDIRRCPTQPRKAFLADSLNRLSLSIDRGGQMVPGMIRRKPGVTPYELIDGERRWRSIKLIPAERRPLYKAELIKAEDDVVQFLISGTVNFNREGHTPLETADTIDRLLSLEFPMPEVASLLGISEFWAYQIHGLKKLTPAVANMLDRELPKEKQLPVTAAIQIAKAPARLQPRLAQRVVNKELRLAHLRREIVQTAQRAGADIRIREVSTSKKWESVGNKIDVAARTLADVEQILKADREVQRMTSWASEARTHRQTLERARKTVVRLQQLFGD